MKYSAERVRLCCTTLPAQMCDFEARVDNPMPHFFLQRNSGTKLQFGIGNVGITRRVDSDELVVQTFFEFCLLAVKSKARDVETYSRVSIGFHYRCYADWCITVSTSRHGGYCHS